MSPAPAVGVLVLAAILRLAAVPAFTVKLVEVPVMEPWVAVIVVGCALVRTTDGVAIPFEKVTEVADPNAVPATVGAVLLGLFDAPENTRDLDPV